MDTDGSTPPHPPYGNNNSQPAIGPEGRKFKAQTGQPRPKNCRECKKSKRGCVAVPGQACVGCQKTNKDCSNVATPAHVSAASHSAIQGDNILAAVDQAGFDRVSQRLTGPPNLLPELRGINTLPMPGFSGVAWNSQHSPGYPQPPAGLYRSDLAAETSRMGNAPYGLDIDPRLWAPDHNLQHPQLGPEQGHATAFRSTECDHPFQQPSAVSQEEPVQDVPYVGHAERTVDNQESDDQPEVNN
ncbi:hypothetical protein LTS03_006065 [Exophiala xenobiotica]|nr:hypothetical protein LTR41_006389 [Exophiala xenobiotica]KAK5219954.1 hypothetical protein LTR72_007485 [Exophiala xenobiotica]KAK5292771.1 hypothetical protein LTR14_005120 [Exophiala xenobiotica]KAK5322404.1 hypothetical protein LTR93_005607 [Exophiala xenobiotica]KAK5350930.1 hypothetical protein LTR61_005283 [Exophiala xenobiotica]